MKTVSVALAAHLASETTTLCTLWKLTRRDGVSLGFTDLDRDVTFESLTYKAATGYTRTALSSDAQLSVDNMDLEGLLASDALTSGDIRGGLYDWAELLVRMINYTDTTQGAVILRRGFLGEFTLKGGVFQTELRGLSQMLSRNFIETTTPTCRADLGDARCKVNLTLHRETGTVGSVPIARRAFIMSITGSRPLDYFNGGLLTWSTGDNAGSKTEIKAIDGALLTLYLPAAEDIATGDTFTVRAGCDKTVTMCSSRFSNIANNRSFPFIPGPDQVLRTPDVRTQ
jgi:uncharacterized phage protein (TIGR02218 family)